MAAVTSTRVARKCRPLSVLVAFGIAALLLAPSFASAQIALGTAQNFGVLAGSTVTNTGPSHVFGNVGVSPGTAITGFFPIDGGPGTATGSYEAGNGTALTAKTDLAAANVAATGTACGTDLTGLDLGTVGPLTPGVYCYTASAGLTGTLTLDFLGNPNAAFLFKIGTGLTTAGASSVVAINTGGAGCLPNINWQVGSSAILGTTSNFSGNILADQSITLTTGANLRGRALASVGAVTLDSNLNVGGCPVAPAFVGGPIPAPGVGAGIVSVPTLQEWTLIFLGLLLATMGGWYVRRQGIGR